MTREDVAAELAKLAYQLGVPVEALDCVATVSSADLRELRRQIGEAMFEANKHQFSTMATMAKAVPSALSARISQLVLPPLLAARTAELFDPTHAADLTTRMASEYLAEIALAMDPGRAPAVVAAIPADRVALVAVELAARQEWIAMGAFVSFVSESGLHAAITALDGEQLLQIGFVLDDKTRLVELSALISHRQLDQLLQAAHEKQLWQELDGLLSDLDDDQLDRLLQRYEAAAPATRAEFAAARQRAELSEAGYQRLNKDKPNKDQ